MRFGDLGLGGRLGGLAALWGHGLGQSPPTVTAHKCGANRAFIYLQESLVVPSTEWGIDSRYRVVPGVEVSGLRSLGVSEKI